MLSRKDTWEEDLRQRPIFIQALANDQVLCADKHRRGHENRAGQSGCHQKRYRLLERVKVTSQRLRSSE